MIIHKELLLLPDDIIKLVENGRTHGLLNDREVWNNPVMTEVIVREGRKGSKVEDDLPAVRLTWTEMRSL